MDLRGLGSRLIAVNVLRRNQVFERSSGCELYRGQLPVLEVALHFPGITQADAAAKLGVTPASIALSTKRLAKSGLIEKRTDPVNKRRNGLYATEAGKRAAEISRANFDEIDRDTFAGFSGDELDTLAGMLERMIQNLNKGRPEMPYCLFYKEDSSQP